MMWDKEGCTEGYDSLPVNSCLTLHFLNCLELLEIILAVTRRFSSHSPLRSRVILPLTRAPYGRDERSQTKEGDMRKRQEPGTMRGRNQP